MHCVCVCVLGGGGEGGGGGGVCACVGDGSVYMYILSLVGLSDHCTPVSICTVYVKLCATLLYNMYMYKVKGYVIGKPHLLCLLPLPGLRDGPT